MSVKRVVLRTFADHDAETAVDYYVREVDAGTALNFIDAFDAAKAKIVQNPKRGSPRCAVRATCRSGWYRPTIDGFSEGKFDACVIEKGVA